MKTASAILLAATVTAPVFAFRPPEPHSGPWEHPRPYGNGTLSSGSWPESTSPPSMTETPSSSTWSTETTECTESTTSPVAPPSTTVTTTSTWSTTSSTWTTETTECTESTTSPVAPPTYAPPPEQPTTTSWAKPPTYHTPPPEQSTTTSWAKPPTYPVPPPEHPTSWSSSIPVPSSTTTWTPPSHDTWTTSTPPETSYITTVTITSGTITRYHTTMVDCGNGTMVFSNGTSTSAQIPAWGTEPAQIPAWSTTATEALPTIPCSEAHESTSTWGPSESATTPSSTWSWSTSVSSSASASWPTIASATTASVEQNSLANLKEVSGFLVGAGLFGIIAWTL